MDTSKGTESLQYSTIRNELLVIQKNLQKMRNQFSEIVAAFPSKLNEQVSLLQRQQKEIQEHLGEERFSIYQKNITQMKSKVNNLSSSFQIYLQDFAQLDTDKKVKSIIAKIEETVNNETKKMRDECRSSAINRINSFRDNFRTQKPIVHRKFKSPISKFVSKSLKQENQTSSSSVFERLMDAKLKKSNERISEMKDSLEIANNWYKKPVNSSKTEEFKQQFDELHEKISDLAARVSCLKDNDQSYVLPDEFIDYLKSPIMASNSKITKDQIKQYGLFVLDKLNATAQGFENTLSSLDLSFKGIESKYDLVRKQINSAENSIGELNEGLDILLSQIDDEDFSRTQTIVSHEKPMSNEEAIEIFRSFKNELARNRGLIEKEITKLKKDILAFEIQYKVY